MPSPVLGPSSAKLRAWTVRALEKPDIKKSLPDRQTVLKVPFFTIGVFFPLLPRLPPKRIPQAKGERRRGHKGKVAKVVVGMEGTRNRVFQNMNKRGVLFNVIFSLNAVL